MLNNNNNNNNNNPPENPDELSFPKDNLFAGEPVLNSTLYNIKRLLLSSTSFPVKKISSAIERLIGQLPQEQDKERVRYLLSSSISHYDELQQLEQRSGKNDLIDYKFDAYLNFAYGIRNTLETLESIYQKELEEAEASNSEVINEYDNYLFQMRVLKYRFSLCCAPIREKFQTNISSILFATNSEASAHFEIQNNYTTLSPIFLCLAISNAINQKQLFFEELTTEFSKRFQINDFIQALNDEDFEYTALAFTTIEDKIKISQDGYDLIINFDCPASLQYLALKNIACYDEMLSPLKDIMNSVGGDISVTLEDDALRVTLSCPEQEPPQLFFDKVVGDAEVFRQCHGNNQFTTVHNPTVFEVYHSLDKSKPLTVAFPHDCLNYPEVRQQIAQALKLATELDSFTNLNKLTFYYTNDQRLFAKYTFTTEEGLTVIKNSIEELSVEVQGLTNGENIKDICNLLKMIDCVKLGFKGDANSLHTQLSDLFSAIDKTRLRFQTSLNLTYGLHNHMGAPIVEICNSNNELLLMACHGAYDPTQQRKVLAGRCHSPELTHKVSDIFRKILIENPDPALDLSDKGFYNCFLEKLADHNIYLTPSFKALLHKLSITKSVADLNSFNYNLQNVLFYGMMSIDEHDGKITLDRPAWGDGVRDFYFDERKIV